MTHRKLGCLLILLIVWGIALRLYRFGSNPASLNRDEAALGYNAFTIGRYGTDEWGSRWPLLFASFGDYKLPGYIYTLAPLIRVFGVQGWVIRLPSLLAGLGLICLAYALTRTLTHNREMGLWAAAVVAVTPWAIFYSRMAWEAHLALFWLVLAIYIWLLPFHPIRFLGSLLAYGIAVATYNTPWILAPALILFILSLTHLTGKQKGVVAGMVAGMAVVFGLLLIPLTAQKQQITIFSDPTLQARYREGYSHAVSLPQKIARHRVTFTANLMARRFWESLGPRFLVYKGGNHPWHAVPGWGHLLLITYLLSVLSLILIVGKKLRSPTNRWSILILTILSLVPAIVTVDAPHATRSLLFLFLIGMMSVWPAIKWPKMIPLVAIGLLIESGFYAYRYFGVYPHQHIPAWPTGLEAAIDAAERRRLPNQPVVVIGEQPTPADVVRGEQAYIYALLYTQAKPDLLFAQQPKDAAGMVRVTQTGYYLFDQRPEKTVPPLTITRQVNGYYQLED